MVDVNDSLGKIEDWIQIVAKQQDRRYIHWFEKEPERP